VSHVLSGQKQDKEKNATANKFMKVKAKRTVEKLVSILAGQLEILKVAVLLRNQDTTEK